MNVIFQEIVNCFLLKMKFTNHQKMLITYGVQQQEREKEESETEAERQGMEGKKKGK